MDSMSSFFSSLCIIQLIYYRRLQTCPHAQNRYTISLRERQINNISYVINLQMNSFRQSQQISLDRHQILVPKRQKVLSKSILYQHRAIIKQNDYLKKQLQHLSIKLDDQIRKRLKEQGAKPKLQGQQSQMELVSAYKKCQIYKKQANFYKKKLDSLENVEKYVEIESKSNEYIQQISRLNEEIKNMKRINKLQQKGLIQAGAGDYLKIAAQKEKLREEVKSLMKQVDQYHRTSQSNANKQRKNHSTLKNSKVQPTQQLKQKDRRRIRSEMSESQQMSLQKKWERDVNKIQVLNTEISKLKQKNSNLKQQLQEKEKQNKGLKQKIIFLRKHNLVIQSQMNQKSQPELQIQQQTEFRAKIQTRTKTEQSHIVKRVWRQEASESFDSHPESSRKTKNVKEDKQGVQWNDSAFNSRIRQMRVIMDKQGRIADIHAKYEKGFSKIYECPEGYKVFVCNCSPDQYIKRIAGSFYEGYLEYLQITTSSNRLQKYGSEIMEADETFKFQDKGEEHIGALFGTNDERGVRKLGCIFYRS